jgi:hypothetical protein
MTMARVDELARDALAFALWLVAVILNMSAALWLGFQCLKWLHDGYWTSQPTVMFWVRGFCAEACSFMNNPHSWYGAAKLARLLSDMPSGAALVLLGIVCGVLSVSVSDHRPEALSVTNTRNAAPGRA